MVFAIKKNAKAFEYNKKGHNKNFTKALAMSLRGDHYLEEREVP